ncbi:MAG: hypothetical protein N4A71_05280 [Carboxylicivirga sp.]|jgi:hypothetical protein|nr:hypothetical protein [Carboxylicivirga sp.]
MKKIFFVLITCILVVFNACEKEKIIKEYVDPQVYLKPTEISFSSSDEQKKIYLSVENHQKTDYQLITDSKWINFDLQSGSINDNIIEHVVTVNKDGFKPGVYKDSIYVLTNNAGTVSASVVMYVDREPKLSVKPAALSFLPETDNLTLEIKNEGNCELSYHLRCKSDWLILPEYTYGNFLEVGYTVKPEITCNILGLAPGEYKDTIYVDYASEQIKIPVDLSVAEQSKIVVHEEQIIFAPFVTEYSFYIYNHGNVKTNAKLAYNETYMSLEDKEYQIEAGDSALVKLKLIEENLSDGDQISESIKVSNSNQEIDLPVVIHYQKERKMRLEHNIIDADYNPNTKMLVTVASDPLLISFYDIVEKDTLCLPLPSSPKCVSISPNGKIAAVGHDAMVSFFDITTRQLINQWYVNVECRDILVSNDGFAYVSLKNDNWETPSITGVNRNNGNVNGYASASTSNELQLVFQPKTNNIYSLTLGVSPEDIYKWTIDSSKAAKYQYDSEYHGDYSMGSDLWITDDGKRIITSSGNTFSTANDKSQDVKYAGKIVKSEAYNYEKVITHVDDAADRSELIIVDTKKDWNEIKGATVQIINATNLMYKKTLALENYHSNYNGQVEEYEAVPIYAFYNNHDDNYLVITTSLDAPFLNKWAIQTID